MRPLLPAAQGPQDLGRQGHVALLPGHRQDQHDTTTSPSSTAAFAYLKGRTRSTLPELKARFAPSAAPDKGGDRPGKRKKCNAPEARGGEGDVAAHVLLFVTDRMNEDLYRELMMGLHMR